MARRAAIPKFFPALLSVKDIIATHCGITVQIVKVERDQVFSHATQATVETLKSIGIYAASYTSQAENMEPTPSTLKLSLSHC